MQHRFLGASEPPKFHRAKHKSILRQQAQLGMGMRPMQIDANRALVVTHVDTWSAENWNCKLVTLVTSLSKRMRKMDKLRRQAAWICPMQFHIKGRRRGQPLGCSDLWFWRTASTGLLKSDCHWPFLENRTISWLIENEVPQKMNWQCENLEHWNSTWWYRHVWHFSLLWHWDSVNTANSINQLLKCGGNVEQIHLKRPTVSCLCEPLRRSSRWNWLLQRLHLPEASNTYLKNKSLLVPETAPF